MLWSEMFFFCFGWGEGSSPLLVVMLILLSGNAVGGAFVSSAV